MYRFGGLLNDAVRRCLGYHDQNRALFFFVEACRWKSGASGVNQEAMSVGGEFDRKFIFDASIEIFMHYKIFLYKNKFLNTKICF